MYYTVRHVTRFVYDEPISESVMEARMQPRSDGLQRCVQFGLTTTPSSRVMVYQDHDGNIVHHFAIPGAAFAADGGVGSAGRVPAGAADPVRPRARVLGAAGDDAGGVASSGNS